MVNCQIIPIEVLSTDRGYNCAYTITQGDTNAYILKITYTDITEFDGTVTLRFTFPDGTYADRENVVIDGSTITYTMDETDYSQRNVSVFVRHADSTIIHTTLKINFVNIRALPGNSPTTEIKSYPEWAADMIGYDITVGTVETLAPGTDATASVTGDVPDKVLNLGIPQGVKGNAGEMTIGTVTTLTAGESATVGNSGTSGAAVLDFGIPQGATGPANTLAIGSVTTVAAGGSATATVTGDAPNQTLNLGIPQGATGPANTLAIGSVTTVAAGGSATATVTGDAPNQTLNLGIPQGATGPANTLAIGSVTTVAAGESATVTNIGTSTDAVLDIGIPQGIPGEVQLSDLTATNIYYTDTNSNLGDATDVQTALDSAGAHLADKADDTRQLAYWNRPAAYKIKVAAGRFNMSWNNASGRLWVFPAGTVLYSDGTTPISTSTAEKPDVTIPAGGGYVWLVSAMWNGPYSLNGNDTDARITGALSDLPPLTYYLDLYNCSLVTGALSDLPPLTSYLGLGGCTLVTGALSDLPPLTYYLGLGGCSLVTGDLSDLPPLNSTLSLSNCSQVTGALSDLPPLTYYLDLYNCSLVTGSLSDLPPLNSTLSLSNCSQVTGAYTAVNGDNVPTTTILTGTGLSATDMDNTLIAYAACTKTGGKFTATGKTRTTASDAAVLHLTTPTGSGGLGWTVAGLTVV